MMTPTPTASGMPTPAMFGTAGITALNGSVASDILLSQYYTQDHVAAHLYSIFRKYFNPYLYQMVEPSAGTGAFYKILPSGSLGYDVDPRYPGILRTDFLKIAINSRRPVAVIGNPPFGKNSSMAIKFFNRAAVRASVIALILPRTFRKASTLNKLNPGFHLLVEEEVSRNAFLFRGKPFDIPAVFQIWVRRRELREIIPQETTHPDFKFVKFVKFVKDDQADKADQADFAIKRVGAGAGRVHHDFTLSENSHYFIKGPVEKIMRQLDFASVAGNVAGNPSLARSEIVALYRAWKKLH